MIWLLLLLTTPAFAQTDLSAIKGLESKLPSFNDYKQSDDEIEIQRKDNKYQPPQKIISLEEIKQSGTQMGAINPGVPIQKLSDFKSVKVTKSMYVKFFNLEDEQGFKYVQNNDGSVTWRILSRYVEPIKEELSLYVPPTQYTPAPDNIVRAEYDKKLTIPPEISFYTGIVQGNYIKDLFNDNKAGSGLSNQYGIHFFTQWKLPIKAGGVFHYEKASYRLDNGGQVLYSSPSIGPQFKTKDFEIFGHPIRFQTQFRVSPFARATGKTAAGETTFKFNSADLLASIERPIKNRFGEFVLGFYTQTQWLNIKDQSTNVQVDSTNATNRSFGLSFAQVFE